VSTKSAIFLSELRNASSDDIGLEEHAVLADPPTLFLEAALESRDA
jgi:hypothetical protein